MSLLVLKRNTVEAFELTGDLREWWYGKFGGGEWEYSLGLILPDLTLEDMSAFEEGSFVSTEAGWSGVVRMKKEDSICVEMLNDSQVNEPLVGDLLTVNGTEVSSTISLINLK